MGLGIIGAALGASSALGFLGSRSAGRAQENAARQAADAQLAAARENIAFQQGIYDDTVARFDPFYNSGLDAQNALRFELFGGERPMIGQTYTTPTVETFEEYRPGTTRTTPARAPNDPQTGFGAFWQARGGNTPPNTPQISTTRYRVDGNVFNTLDEAQAWADQNRVASGGTEYQGFQPSQDYVFGLEQGLDAVQSSVAARQGLNSGAALESLNRFGQDYASTRRNEYLNRLAGAASQGQAAAGSQAGAGQYLGGQVGNALTNMGQAQSNAFINAGNARASATMGGVNAINNAIGQGLGAWQYQNMLNAFAT